MNGLNFFLHVKRMRTALLAGQAPVRWQKLMVDYTQLVQKPHIEVLDHTSIHRVFIDHVVAQPFSRAALLAVTQRIPAEQSAIESEEQTRRNKKPSLPKRSSVSGRPFSVPNALSQSPRAPAPVWAQSKDSLDNRLRPAETEHRGRKAPRQSISDIPAKATLGQIERWVGGSEHWAIELPPKFSHQKASAIEHTDNPKKYRSQAEHSIKGSIPVPEKAPYQVHEKVAQRFEQAISAKSSINRKKNGALPFSSQSDHSLTERLAISWGSRISGPSSSRGVLQRIVSLNEPSQSSINTVERRRNEALQMPNPLGGQPAQQPYTGSPANRDQTLNIAAKIPDATTDRFNQLQSPDWINKPQSSYLETQQSPVAGDITPSVERPESYENRTSKPFEPITPAGDLDLSTLADNIKTILEEEARRFGIDL